MSKVLTAIELLLHEVDTETENVGWLIDTKKVEAALKEARLLMNRLMKEYPTSDGMWRNLEQTLIVYEERYINKLKELI